jgi:hypothetical protein
VKRYFRRTVAAGEIPLGAGVVWLEFDGDEPTRQVERYGDRWFSSRDEYHPELGPGLADLPLSELGLEPMDEVDAAEFERAWTASGAGGT